MLFISIETYGNYEVNEICATASIDGVIIGDLLCQKKMFRYAGYELEKYVRQFVECKKKVIYQTPMYATERIFQEIIDRINYLVSENLLEAVIVQDIGVINKIHNMFPDMRLIWSKWGYARTPNINPATVDFYRTLGVNAFECKNQREVNYIQEKKLKPYFVYGTQQYLTVNRECYYEYQHDIFDGDCERGCLKKEKISIPTQVMIDSTIDGKLLGLQYVYEEITDDMLSKYDIIVCADKWDNLQEKLERFKR